MAFWIKALLCIFTVSILGNLSGLLTVSSIGGWYETLQRPPGTPPNAVFGPVWMLLYVMMGYALALVWHTKAEKIAKRRAYYVFAIQMILNLSWTPLFFGLHRMDIALIVIWFLVATIGVAIYLFRPVNRWASMLLVPYFFWVVYASYLNAGFLMLNR